MKDVLITTMLKYYFFVVCNVWRKRTNEKNELSAHFFANTIKIKVKKVLRKILFNSLQHLDLLENDVSTRRRKVQDQ